MAANATDRAVRGQSRSPKHDGIYRAEQRGESRHTHARAEAVAAELLKGNLRVEAGKAKLLETRREVEQGWWAVSDILVAEGRPELAAQVRRFSAEMPPPWTDRESIAEALRRRSREVRTHRRSPGARIDAAKERQRHIAHDDAGSNSGARFSVRHAGRNCPPDRVTPLSPTRRLTDLAGQ